MHNYCTQDIIKENFENFLIHRCKYILLSQVYYIWQFVETSTIIFNNPVYWYPCTAPVILPDINESWNFWTDFRKILKYHILWQSFQWEPNCCIWTDRQTEMTKLVVPFSNSANAPKSIFQVIWQRTKSNLSL